MANQALYRKYRPSDFSQAVGQDHVVQTLTSAIVSGHVSHAYLFTGPRGTGKTSIARLLARALNCTGTSKPCNTCANCLAALQSSLDVVEIDAASNRSIDAIRDLREKVGLAPTQGQYKVYIIDEVHMLTTEAFNALLKTLEEPPAHAVFILATTEAHKVPETIISRTQRFNFRPIGMADLTRHLGEMARQEQIEIDPEALELIAMAARGGFRDAISLLDQVAGSGQPVHGETVRALLGYSDAGELEALSQAIAQNDARTALTVLKTLEESGAQPGQIALQLTELWRAILLASVGASRSPNPIVQELASTLASARTAQIVQSLLEVSRSHWPQLALEAAVVTLAAPQATTNTPPPSPTPAKRTSQTAPMAKPATKTNPEPLTPEDPTETSGMLKAELWPKVLVLLKSQNNSLCALLQMYPIDFGAGEITIKPRFNFHRDLFLKPVNRTMIEAAASKVYGTTVRVNAQTEETGVPQKHKRGPDPATELVSSALEILGGEVVD